MADKVSPHHKSKTSKVSHYIPNRSLRRTDERRTHCLRCSTTHPPPGRDWKRASHFSAGRKWYPSLPRLCTGLSEIELPPSRGMTLTHSTSGDCEPKMLEGDLPPPTRPRILVFERKTFWILALVAIILVIGIMAGKVGGVISFRANSPTQDKKNEKSKPDMPFKMQTWENNDKTGSSQIFYLEVRYKMDFLVRFYE